MNRYVKKCICVVFLTLIAGIVSLPMNPVKAANPTKAILKKNKTYRCYDITGDKKKDTIKIETEMDSYIEFLESVTVWINGKRCFSINKMRCGETEVDARIYTLKNGKPFLYLYTIGDDNDGAVCGIFQYRSGKLKQVINCNAFLGTKYGMHFNGEIVKVKGNTITVDFNIMSWTTGVSTFRYKFIYKNGTLKRLSSKTTFVKIATYPKVSLLTVTKGMKAYSKPNGKKVLFSIKPGQKIKVNGAYVKKGIFYLKIKNNSNGKSGWIKCYKSYPKDDRTPFKEIFYAG